MIFLVHNQAKTLVFCKKEDKELSLKAKTISEAFWELAMLFPEELIIWMEEGQESNFNKDSVIKIFHHDLIMASFAVKTRFLDDRIGYVDELPFVNVKRNVQYPTWLMSADVGGIKGKVLLKLRSHFQHITNFGYLLNAIAKIGQQNGLFCYSAPGLVHNFSEEIKYTASNRQLFQFVAQFYKKPRLAVLGWCFKKYENENYIFSLVRSLLKKNFFQQKLDLSDITTKSSTIEVLEDTIDVVIPTIGRPKHLLNVLADLKQQALIPKNIIIVEQKADPKEKSDFYFKPEDWPFKINHVFTHKTGACKSRNLALSMVTSNYVFLCDDDNRFKDNIIRDAIKELNRIGAEVINTGYIQKDEAPVYHKMKQWGTFGSGNAFLKTKTIKNVKFDEAFEFGYGEDIDFGCQLRNSGIDIVYLPNIEILHLKAPMGGFRQQMKNGWEEGALQPKPSPTFMSYLKKNYNDFQILGYKTVLWLKYYKKQQIKNPFDYNREMEKRWRLSDKIAKQILSKTSFY
ncbi:MAG: glycosyl transferase [Zunongwangia sp.]|jgi:glycosyltransferase involved in cell wall biosynthesis|uniref:glycosyltransferase family 2 protein n=1 Tax=Zunongwangia profunda TaxID=398743 RepID=UPI000C8D61FD|nr:glycosyltransferase [Zunongwangia profunda]MAG88406.1 glycosyl transferase [Flavobacteriaceae bacterium]MAO35685.1 glycosyl transferase [Zunongwangia sp.]MCC4230182.1 glycosyltransferase [Zunongwangia profunda]|tara:strand:+ start:26820 stop:28361 length:1542 start_codon:yes stop_codon:yes gene_type:complete